MVVVVLVVSYNLVEIVCIRKSMVSAREGGSCSLPTRPASPLSRVIRRRFPAQSQPGRLFVRWLCLGEIWYLRPVPAVPWANGAWWQGFDTGELMRPWHQGRKRGGFNRAIDSQCADNFFFWCCLWSATQFVERGKTDGTVARVAWQWG